MTWVLSLAWASVSIPGSEDHLQDTHPCVLIAWCLVTTSQHLGSGQGSQGLPTASRLDAWVRICCGDSWVAPRAVGELGFLLGLFWKRLFPVVVTAAPASVLGVRVRMSGGPRCVRGAGLGARTQALGLGAPVVLCHPHQHRHIGRQRDRRDTQREGRCCLCGREGQGSLQSARLICFSGVRLWTPRRVCAARRRAAWCGMG